MARRADVRVVATAGPERGRGPRTGAVLAAVGACLIAFGLGRASGGSTAPRDTADDPSPSKSVAGVPLGFPRTRDGAVAAMLSHAAVLGEPRDLLDSKRRAQVLALVATPSYAASFRGAAARALEAAGRGPIGQGLMSGATTVYLARPIAYRVVSYRPGVAVIKGWGVSVVGNDRGLTPRASWATTVTTARWSRGDWRIDAVRSTMGPAPALDPAQAPAGARRLLESLHDLRGIRSAP